MFDYDLINMYHIQSRIVIAENLPEDHCYQNLMKIFSTVGRYLLLVTKPRVNSLMFLDQPPRSGILNDRVILSV